MTSRERWLAALDFQPVDRLPFWPKLGPSYLQAQAAPFREQSLQAVHEWIGSDRHEGLPGCVREVRTRTALEVSETPTFQRTLYSTPYRALELHQRFDVASQSWHPVKFPVETREDIEVMTAFYEDCRVEYDPEAGERARAWADEIGQEAVLADHLGESPLMFWVEFLAGIENAQFLLADYPGEVEGLFAALHRLLLRRAEVLCEHSVADMLYMVENTSTTLISPGQFRRYCAHHLADYVGVARAAGRRIVFHMCGHLKALLPDLAQLGATAVEAFTSPPVGNTTLADGRSACPDLCLIGGTNAVLWTRPAERIIAQIAADLEVLPDHRGLVVTSAGVMPPQCSPETIRKVAEWVAGYAVRRG